MFGYVKKWPHFFLSLIENERDDYKASVNMAEDLFFLTICQLVIIMYIRFTSSRSFQLQNT